MGGGHGVGLHLRQVVPVTLGHVGHAALGVVAGGNGDGLIEPPPESLTLQFGLVRSVQVQMVHGTDFPLAVGVEEAFPVVMYLTGISNIRDVLPHPRTVGSADF